MFGISAFVQAPFASLGGDTYSVVVNESTTLSDTNISIVSFLGSLSESTTLTDTNVSIVSFLGSLSESTAISDTESATQNFPVIENASTTAISDTNSASASFVGIQSESTTLTDSYVGGFSYFVNISETETLTDITIGKAAFLTTITENTVLTDTLSAIAQFNTSCIELFSVTDCQFGGGWARIDNTQNSYQPTQYSTNSLAELAFAEVQNNLESPIIGWSAINNDDTNVWSNMADDQNPNWVDINDNQ